MSIRFEALTKQFGARVIGCDVRMPLSENQLNDIGAALNEYKFLVFRNCQLNLDEQVDFCRQFGEIEPHPGGMPPWGNPNITYVANINLEGEIFDTCGPTFELWHSDTCYEAKPARMSFLYAEQVPNAHGETLFADMRRAYEDLPESLKERLADKKAVFGASENLVQRCVKRGYNLHIPVEYMRPDSVHPVFRTHPETGEKSIFVNWGHTDRILDVEEQESDELLEQLYTHSMNSKYRYEHHYQMGDLVVWDNASVIHSNCVGQLTEPRVMRRVMVCGPTPV